MNQDPFNFSKLSSRYIIKGELINQQQIHIGAAGAGGLKESLVDNGFIRIYKGEKLIPYIPGSSLKGVFRSFLERIARAKGDNICDTLDHRSKCQKSKNVCVICAIFGSQSVASHVLLADAYPEIFKMNIKPGVAINRVTGAAQRGALYNIETISPGSRFNFEMIIENIDLSRNSPESEYIRFLLNELIEGHIKIGGKTSAGMGSIKLEIKEIRYITEEMIKNLELQYKKCKISEIISGYND